MLTYSQISSAKPMDKPRKLFDTRGLYLKVMPNGGRYWRFDYQRVLGERCSFFPNPLTRLWVGRSLSVS